MTPKEGVTLKELKGTLLRAQERLLEHKDVCLGAVMGTIEERPDQLVVIVGWKSVEVRITIQLRQRSHRRSCIFISN